MAYALTARATLLPQRRLGFRYSAPKASTLATSKLLTICRLRTAASVDRVTAIFMSLVEESFTGFIHSAQVLKIGESKEEERCSASAQRGWAGQLGPLKAAIRLRGC